MLDFITKQLVSMNLDAVLDVDKALVFMHLPYKDVKLGCQRFLGDDGVLDMIVLPFRQGHTLRRIDDTLVVSLPLVTGRISVVHFIGTKVKVFYTFIVIIGLHDIDVLQGRL